MRSVWLRPPEAADERGWKRRRRSGAPGGTSSALAMRAFKDALYQDTAASKCHRASPEEWVEEEQLEERQEARWPARPCAPTPPPPPPPPPRREAAPLPPPPPREKAAQEEVQQEPQPEARPAPRPAPSPVAPLEPAARRRDITKQKVFVLGDSVMRGLQKIFRQHFANSTWRVDANCGMEALSIPCKPSELLEYDHIFYCSAGNAMWSGRDWAAVERNIRSLDPRRVGVVLLGNAELWSSMAGPQYRPKQPSYFQDAKRALGQQGVHVAELDSCMASLEYADTEGHPSKSARWDLAPLLLEAFRDLAGRRAADELGS